MGFKYQFYSIVLMDLKYKAIILKKRGIKISSIAKTIRKSERTVNKYTKGIPHPNNIGLKPLPKSANGLSIKKAEILGYLSSEGTDYKTVEKRWEFHKNRNKFYWRSRKRSVIEFSNTNNILLKHFQNLMNFIYGYIPKINKKSMIRINRIKVMKDLRKYSRFGSRRWRVPAEILNSNNKTIKKSFCRAFFDGDGTIELKKKEVRMDSKNSIGLKQLAKLLESLGIKCKFYNFRSRFRIVIKDIDLFYSEIGSLHPEKLKKLKFICGFNAPFT